MTAAETIARALGGRRIARNEWRCRCPAHADRDPSLDVMDGDLGVVVRCRAGCTQEEVISALRRQALWPENDGEQHGRDRHSSRRGDGETAQRKVQALRIWDAALDPRYTPAEFYLAQRGLLLPTDAPLSLVRFHPRCPRGSATAPALIVLMRSVRDNQPCGIQRIFIDLQTLQKDRCETSPSGTMMLGACEGAAMMLSSWHDTFWDCLSFCPRLFVCEGFETGVALSMRGHVPVWALGDAGRIARLPLLFAVGQLVICADHDRVNAKTGRRAGLAAALECRARWNASSHQSAVIWNVDSEGEDFADWGRDHGQEGRAAV
jgi:hypothetical protein